MIRAQTQHDIGTLKNKPYSSALRARNALTIRIEQVGGKDAVCDDYHAVQIASAPNRFVIRHKGVCVVNNITLEPFYLYGVEFIDTKIHCGCDSIRYPSQRFDCMAQAKAYATSFNLLSHLASLKKMETLLNEVSVKPVKTVEQNQRESLSGQTIFEHINGELTLNFQS